MATADNALVVMTKAPEPGQVKTRLVPPLSYEEAARLAEALLLDQIDHLASVSDTDLFIDYAPANARSYFDPFSSRGIALFPQQGGDLGARMRHAFERLFALGYARVALIGSDLPRMARATLAAAYDALSEGAEVVFGPSEDGGYCLVGMRRPIFDMFQGIAWSRSDVLSRSLQTLARMGIQYKLLSTSYDIDTFDDVRRLYLNCENGPRTAALLNQLRLRGIL